LFSVLFLLAWAAYVLSLAFNASSDNRPAARLYFSAPLWSGPGFFDYLALVALAAGSLLLAEARREPTPFRGRLAQGILGGILMATGLLGWAWFGSRASHLFGQLPQARMGGELTYRPGLSKVILAYHGQTPHTGGLVLFADGSVSTLPAKEFAETPQAAPPEYPPADTITPFTGKKESELDPRTEGGNPQEILQRAERRAQVLQALRSIYTQYVAFSRQEGRPPQRVEELNLPDELETAVREGTYAVSLGWGLTPPHTIALQEQLRAALFLRWAAFHLAGVGVALLLAGVMARRTETPSTTA
jgi:hypothetical protein